MKIRNERFSDHSRIEEITKLAFLGKPYASGTEHYLAEKLREDEALSLSLVLESEGLVVGHLALSPIKINGLNGPYFGLGPLAVLPEAQGKGYGTELLNSALEYLAENNAKCCVLVGDPNYYSRSGFEIESALTYQGAPTEYFQAIWFTEEKLVGEVQFHEAFE
ncbi:N-acetyltransferase [Vibrio vulnificus]|nr:N-acetyltransferase [Vibrio vulnificus]EME0896093.1 N-acetyltransferase [Vibrio parahaemolyticus]ELC9719009.1 N-acetyltransferase [Vibrio vulnificus]ELS0763750.1 N-acetyltransferase [Vibrio vulnificus]ELV8609877.1 N-acetyltransferase [Vibrio vulnificus]